MRRSIGGVALVALTALWPDALAEAQQAPPVPFEDIGACPFEGCVYRDWTANRPVVVRTSRHVTSPVAFRVRKGEKVVALTGVVVTVKAGRVEFEKPVTLPTLEGDLSIRPGQPLYLLTYQGEGFTKAWFNGRLYHDVDISPFYGSPCSYEDPNTCTGKIVEKWQREWWVQIRNSARRIGWTREPESFDGKDALGSSPPPSRQVPQELSQLLTKANIKSAVVAWCAGKFRAGASGGYAVAVSSEKMGGRYLVVESNATVFELGDFSGSPELSCYTPAEARKINATIRRSETIHGQITPQFTTSIVCGFVEDTRAVCWQYSPSKRAFVNVGGWIT